MTTPFIGQIQPFGFGFPPRNWALCNGQTMSISQNTALFSLLGTMYGGNGVNTFLLPNLQSRVAMHLGTFAGNTYAQGAIGGVEQVPLNINNMPAHNHPFLGTATGDDPNPTAGTALSNIGKSGGGTGNPYYAPDTTPQPINPGSLAPNGGNLAHTNVQPYLTISWCIALSGIYPSRN
jgi:microcystin-dependent protein